MHLVERRCINIRSLSAYCVSLGRRRAGGPRCLSSRRGCFKEAWGQRAEPGEGRGGGRKPAGSLHGGPAGLKGEREPGWVAERGASPLVQPAGPLSLCETLSLSVVLSPSEWPSQSDFGHLWIPAQRHPVLGTAAQGHTAPWRRTLPPQDPPGWIQEGTLDCKAPSCYLEHRVASLPSACAS